MSTFTVPASVSLGKKTGLVVASYVHQNRFAALVRLRTGDPMTAGTFEARQEATQIAMHLATIDPDEGWPTEYLVEGHIEDIPCLAPRPAWSFLDTEIADHGVTVEQRLSGVSADLGDLVEIDSGVLIAPSVPVPLVLWSNG